MIKQQIEVGHDLEIDVKMRNLKPHICQWLHSTWEEIKTIQELIPSEFQLAKREHMPPPHCSQSTFQALKRMEKKILKLIKLNHYLPLLKTVESIKFVDQNVGFAKPNGGQKLRQLARKQKTIK